MMIKILQLALRSMLRFKTYTLINILGLTLSLVCVIVIFRYVHGEFTVDHFNKNLDRVYLNVSQSIGGEDGGFSVSSDYYFGNGDNTPADIMDHPSIQYKSRFQIFEDSRIKVADNEPEAIVLFTDSSFFKIMNYPIIAGTNQINNIDEGIITKSFADRLFGKENPMNKTFLDRDSNIVKIVGIVGDIPTKATINFDVAIVKGKRRMLTHDIVLLHKGADYKKINEQYSDFFSHGYDFQSRNQLRPYSGLYHLPESTYSTRFAKHGNMGYTIILSVVGTLILIIGIINYVNIYSVVVQRRKREFGMKKVFGAKLHHILIQILTENYIMIGGAIVAATILASIVSPIVVKNIGLDQVSNSNFNFYMSTALFLILPFVVSIYPVFQYSYSTSISSIKNIGKNTRTRQGLLLQYIITIVMLIASMFFIKQLRSMLNADPKYRTENIITVSFPLSIQQKNDSRSSIDDIIERELKSSPIFTSWTSEAPPYLWDVHQALKCNFKLGIDGEYKEVAGVYADNTWLNTYEIELIDGDFWKKEDYRVNGISYNIILLESTLKYLGITDYKSAELHPEVSAFWGNMHLRDREAQPCRVIGVVKDFNVGKLTSKYPPLILCADGASGFRYSNISFVPGRKQEAIAFLQKLHDETVGGTFSYTLIENDLANMYKEEKNIATIYSILTAIAIFISMMGLFSMSLFDIQQRYREIAIRKVNGASVAEIIKMLLKKYLKLLTIAFVISAPVAWYTINRYLEDFTLKTPISWWLFVVAFVATAAISLLTLIYQTNKAANQDPAKVLKSE